ncbi:MAG: hypothetical protein NVSMB64_16160 [Candidatus Velthaea sp.]
MKSSAVFFSAALLCVTASSALAQSTPASPLPAPSTASQQQGSNVTGSVVDRSTGLPLSNAVVTVPGTALRTLTDKQGRFTLTVPPGTYAFQAQFTGYQTAETDTVVVLPNQTTAIALSVQRLESNAGNLREIGRTTGRANAALQSATVIQKQLSAVDLLQSGYMRASQAVGDLPNVVYTRGNAVPGDDAQIAIRGISGGTLTLIDGHPTDLPLNSSALFPFQSINVVYGSGKGELYPVNALGGVIDLRTIAPTRLPEATFLQSFGTFDHLTTGVQATGTLNHFGYAASFGIEGIDAPYARTTRFEPRSGFDPSATTGPAVARNYFSLDNPYAVKTGLLKGVYHLSSATTVTATTLFGTQLQNNVGSKSIDLITFDRALADGTNALKGKGSGDACPAGTFTANGPTAPGAKAPTPNGIGPDGLGDGGITCQTPQQYAAFRQGYGTGELGSIATNINYNDLRFEVNGGHSRFVLDGFASLFKRSQDYTSSNYYAVVGDLNGLHTKLTHDSRAGFTISEDLVYKNDEVGVGYYLENYRQNERQVGLDPLSGSTANGTFLFTYGNAVKSLYFRNIYNPNGSPLSVYLYDYIKHSSQPNAFFNDPRLAFLYRLKDYTFRVAAGESSSLPYAPDNQTYQSRSLSDFNGSTGPNCSGGNGIGSAPTGFTKPERASDEEFAIGHRWKGDSTTQFTVYNENFTSKVQYGYNAPLTYTGTSFVDPALLASYQNSIIAKCGGTPSQTLALLTLNGNYNLGRVMARGIDITGRQRFGRNAFLDYSYGTQSVVYRSLPVEVVQGDHRIIIGSQLVTGDDGPTPLHTLSLGLDANNARGLDARVSAHYTSAGNPQGLQAFTRTDLNVTQALHRGSLLTVSVYNLFNYDGTYDKLVGYGVPFALNQYAGAGDYNSFFGRASANRFGIGPRTITFTYTVKAR